MRSRVLLAPLIVLAAAAAAAAIAAPAVAAPAHRAPARHVAFSYLGETELPHALQVDGTTVGGLSGISWDARTGRYLIISDDRSQTDPARFYTASIAARPGAVSVRLRSTEPLRQPDGSVFPPTSADGSVVAPDPEGIAVDPRSRRFAWSSEGERKPAPLTLGDPAVRLADPDGRTRRVLPLAPQLHMNAQEVGPRQNQTLEGLSYTPKGDALWAAMEDPLVQDGEDPTATHGARVRFTEHSGQGLPIAQYAYPLEPLFEPGGATATNGVSDIAALGGGRFLVIERAFTTKNKIRVYEADATRATDVLARDALGSAPLTPMRKRLAVDLDAVRGLPRVDNVEGIAVGPRLPDGRRLVVLVSDDNFSTSQVTQVIAFAASGI
ncbi:esterase-like activity of phytase family protein [Amnibacterium setariae]|uniref:Esterase-like activity of phytase family protein n=1 Tax=Amnibacterium setariae TaxID=2306585 RepID=A0A3A1U5J6_9MICO|nr:esterase-like activity of phytase family protein [Amnibacterium setariae]RIX30717.1 esterase-like activity of phytase family protein [Amnibacterium setariae]